MSKPEISFSGTNITVRELTWQVEHPVLQAFVVGSNVIVLYDPHIHKGKFGQFTNLVAFCFEGEKLWTAELPTNESGDSYRRAYVQDGLMADSWKSFACRIDESSGRIRSRTYYK